MTEEEARTKRCPAPMGTMHDERVQNHCIGSACMAWRWYFSGGADQQRHAALIDVYQKEKNCLWIEANDWALSQRVGYCGLAGKP